MAVPPDPLTDVWRYVRERWRDERSPSSRSFDADLGVSTARWTLSGYEPTPVELAHDVLGAMPLPAEGTTFVDLGCGKGRMLLLAARHPFARVLGIEHDGGLVATAQRNLREARDPSRRCDDVSALLMDARTVPWPHTPLVLFLYNPFDDQVFDEVLDELEASLQAAPRPCALAYVNPLFVASLQGHRWQCIDEGGEGVARWGWWLPPELR